ncbi:unnamed protein product [Caenorhabditis angaria]|uniref:Uncharacterized protein n=1 Tax=Caenorhabditis angaria TaxID=860376 RepID=A0A9P1N0Q0_9PELO|nr:unnamed protein product [Caenorhabditis angaria]
MEVFARVNPLSFGTSFVVFIDRRDSIFPYEIDMIILCKFVFLKSKIIPRFPAIACGCCGVTMYTSTIHFIFRYWAIERKGRLNYFKGYWMIFWLSVPIFMGALWTFVIYFCMQLDQTAIDYISPSLMNSYGLEISDTAIVGAYFYSPNKIQFYKNLCGMSVLTLTMVLSISIMGYCGIRIFRKVRKIYKKGGARGTKKLQAQLYKALVAQTILPLFLVFIPIGCVFYFPLILIDIGIYSQIPNVTVAIYPIFEPLPSLIIIDEYRIGFWNMLKLRFIRDNQVEPERRTVSVSYELQRRVNEESRT